MSSAVCRRELGRKWRGGRWSVWRGGGKAKKDEKKGRKSNLPATHVFNSLLSLH